MPLQAVSSDMMANKRQNYAIGVFDSGLGGLTVVKELMRQLPRENIVYFGDTARVPYGTKSKETIIRFSKENVSFLLRHRVKMIVIACNTSSSLALPTLKHHFPVPLIGVIEPGAKKAVLATRNKKVGVIATLATINSQAYAESITQRDKAIKVISQACPLFVPLAEEGWFDKKVTYEIAQEYLTPLITSKCDTLILGCTHYPLLKNVLKKTMGRGVTLIDSAQEVTREVKEFLQKEGLERRHHTTTHLFFVSDEPQHFRKLARRFLGHDIRNVRRTNHV